MVFQQIAVKDAIYFSSEIKIFENTAFGHVNEVPTKTKFSILTIRKMSAIRNDKTEANLCFWNIQDGASCDIRQQLLAVH